MLYVRNSISIRITKVKPWVVYFSYGGDKYLLHNKEDDDSVITLYKRIPKNKCGAFKLEVIASKYGGDVERRYIKYKFEVGRETYWRAKFHRPYSDIDVKHFLLMLCLDEFACGELDDEVRQIRMLNSMRNDMISNMRKKIRSLEMDMDTLLIPVI